jgi:hypothetical protein
MVSTHDFRFAHLLEVKLRPVGPNRRTVVVALDDWFREGPTFTQRDVAEEREPLRIAV